MHRDRRTRLAWLVGLAAIVAAAAAPLRAGTLHVPADQPTVQLAIDAATTGDTILVAPGTWVEQIDFLGKCLVIQSDGGAAVTTLDAAGAGTTVMLNGAEPVGTTLRGFTVTGGATGRQIDVTSQFGTYSFMAGGGVFVGTGAHLDLIDCVITGNTVQSATLPTYGGGVSTFLSTVALEDCTLSDNVAERGAALSQFYGHGVTLNACTIAHNTATLSYAGAIDMYYSNGLLAANCLVTDNVGSGLTAEGTAAYTGCVFAGNSGYGCSVSGPTGVDLVDCSFLGNGLGGAALGEGSAGSEHSVRNCIFAAGDVVLAAADVCDFQACTFSASHISTGNGGFVFINVSNCIARGTGGAFVQGSTITTTVSWSDVEGGAAGAGNFDADPMWVNPAAHDYHLAAGSPCIDSGDPASAPDADLSVADIGALPYAAWDDLGGGVSTSTSSFQVPRLTGQGLLVSGQTAGLRLANAAALKPATLLVGLGQIGIDFKGGILWPTLDVVIPNLVTDASGVVALAATWPPGVPSGTTLHAQYWLKSPTSVQGFAASNGVRATVP